ncbi:hypothetical protein BC832DRAFT_558224 [Gaertneriomyces semiglobifer]|nr:hypothetical protein BC832DRAFT_558224 [Gaertneriomyces semiglobifer]
MPPNKIRWVPHSASPRPPLLLVRFLILKLIFLIMVNAINFKSKPLIDLYSLNSRLLSPSN